MCIYICNYWVISINWHNTHFLVPGMVSQSHLWTQFLKWVTSQIAVLTPLSIIRCWTRVAEPVPKASQYQPDLSHYSPAPPNYWWQPFRAHPCYKAPWCIRMPQGTSSTWLERARNCNYIPHYNCTQVQFQFEYNNMSLQWFWPGNLMDLNQQLQKIFLIVWNSGILHRMLIKWAARDTIILRILNLCAAVYRVLVSWVLMIIQKHGPDNISVCIDCSAFWKIWLSQTCLITFTCCFQSKVLTSPTLE